MHLVGGSVLNGSVYCWATFRVLLWFTIFDLAEREDSCDMSGRLALCYRGSVGAGGARHTAGDC